MRHQRRFGRHSDRLWLLAPLGKPAARRVARTFGALRGLSRPGRALLAVLPAAVFLYFFYRNGEQVTGGLDPNFTVPDPAAGPGNRAVKRRRAW